MQPVRKIEEKIFNREEIQAWVETERQSGKRIGFTCGTFDILHAGHVEYLAAARRYCDALLVAINSDASVRGYKNPLRPINPEEHRRKVVAALETVDAVTPMEETRPAALIQLLKPDVYIKGGDYSAENLRSKPLVESYGGQVVSIPIHTDTSTTAILERAALIELHDKPNERATTGEPRLVFLDRDGTLIRETPYLHDPARVELLPGVLEGLRALEEAGYRLVVISNQQGIGLGYYTELDFFEVNRAMLKQLAPAGIKISRIYYCPHSLADGCECRKPGKLLLERAAEYFGAKFSNCYFIGDLASDCEAAAAVGCPSVLLGDKSMADGPCSYRAISFQDAVDWILARSSTSQIA